MSVQAKAARIRLVLFDVDGVLTDGKILLHPDGTESKQFDIKDGTGLVWAQRAGLKVGVISARTSAATAQRAAQLGITIVQQGVPSKLRAYDDVLQQLGFADADAAYMGDDVLDLPIVGRVGLSGCPADGAEEVRSRVDYVSRAGGGNGAAREFVELILKAQGRWTSLVASYVGEESATARAAGSDAATKGRANLS
jgi:3-deoxy-D-manno-octulosonate 8-phosphate phosphatase (KDO 8-P phosphatase)